MNTKTQQIIDNYAHDYRNMELDYDHLRVMLMEMVESITKKKSNWKYSREQVELWMGAYESYFPPQIRDSYRKLKENLLAKQSTPKKKVNKFVSSCCSAETKFIGNVYAGYEECSKCGKRCKLVLSTPKKKSKEIELKRPNPPMGNVGEKVELHFIGESILYLADTINKLKENK